MAKFSDKRLGTVADEIAPDGSEVRRLVALPRGSMGHFTIPAGQIIRAVRHKSVDEIWYVLEGSGEMWRKGPADERVISLHKGVSLSIPVGTSFQVRSTGRQALHVLGQTMPRWPGDDEAEIVAGKWTATLVTGEQ